MYITIAPKNTTKTNPLSFCIHYYLIRATGALHGSASTSLSCIQANRASASYLSAVICISLIRTLGFSPRLSVSDVALFRFRPRSLLPNVSSSATGVAVADILASSAAFLACFSAFLASVAAFFAARSAHAFSRSSKLTTLAAPIFSDFVDRRTLASLFISLKNPTCSQKMARSR